MILVIGVASPRLRTIGRILLSSCASILLFIFQIPLSQEGRPWFYYVDPSVTEECLRGKISCCLKRIKKKIVGFQLSVKSLWIF